MANNIRYTAYGTKDLVGSSSRYHAQPVIIYGEKNKVTFAIYKKQRPNQIPEHQYYEIHKSFEYRPDLVSNEIYGLPDYWWRIMQENGMKDILEFKAGRNIKIPGGSLM